MVGETRSYSAGDKLPESTGDKLPESTSDMDATLLGNLLDCTGEVAPLGITLISFVEGFDELRWG